MALWLIKALLIVFIVIMVVSLIEKDYKIALYWLGASIIQLSIIAMKGGM